MTALLYTAHQDDALPTQLERLRNLSPLPCFSPATRGFVEEFSRRILKLPELRRYPELATLSHWFRPAAIDQLCRKAAIADGSVMLPRGLVFHLAPANVDVLFAYAWLLSVLCGNRNVARLSQKPGAQRDALIGILHDFQQEALFPEVLQRTVLLTYPHNDAITREISTACHARIIWGGDATVTHIRSIPLAPLALEMAFPDRFGVAVVRADAIASMEAGALSELARRFCNDMLWFGQQACSSPRCLYWVGEPDRIAAAKAVFWPAMQAQAAQFEDEPAALMARVTDAYLLAARTPDLQLADTLATYPLHLTVPYADGHLREQQSGHGLVIEVDLPTLHALAVQLDDRDQTLIQHGFSHEDLAALLRDLPNRAVDRVVPIGRALDFHHIWDGSDLLRIFSRQTTLGLH